MGESAFSYDRERLRKIKTMIAEGRNPYASVVPVDQGGLEQDREERKSERLQVLQDRSDKRTEELESYWRSNAGTKVERVFLPDGLFPDLFSPLEPINHEVLICSFCGSKTDRINGTRGVSQPRKVIKTEIVVRDGIRMIEESISHVGGKVIACPDCILSIKPITQKCRCGGDEHCSYCAGTERAMVGSGINWPETE